MFLVDALKVDYPLVMTNIAIENGPVEIVSFPINSMVDLSIVFCKRLPGRVCSSFVHRPNDLDGLTFSKPTASQRLVNMAKPIFRS